ncbi:MAG TPA: ABC transporter permease [Planctomycetaceae bacterium]|jgi:peptide/nickel transport system permease protein|nr:ABC transporter permease [Planctomycetaceae bacterium]
MLAFLVRRILIGAVTLLLITFIIYGLIRKMPGTPLTVNMAEIDPSKRLSQEDLDRLNKAYGLDKPWMTAYAYWLGNVFRLDFGSSFTFKQPVLRVIVDRMPATLVLSITSISIGYLVSIGLGLLSAARNGRIEERFLSGGLYLLYSLPVVVAAVFLQYWFAVQLRWVPIYGMRSTEIYESLSTFERVKDILWHSVLPIVCETYGVLAYYTRFVHANLDEVIRQDYIRTARAKGVGPVGVLVRHAFRNTLIPMVTMLGLTLPALLSGAIIIERIFAWPGMGQLFFNSITERDYPVIMGLVLMFSILTLAGQLLADILYALVDPRVRLS